MYSQLAAAAAASTEGSTIGWVLFVIATAFVFAAYLCTRLFNRGVTRLITTAVLTSIALFMVYAALAPVVAQLDYIPYVFGGVWLVLMGLFFFVKNPGEVV